MVNKQTLVLLVNIKKQRTERKMSQNELARVANIPLTTFIKIETGIIKNPSVLTVAKIAKALGVSIDSLLYNK